METAAVVININPVFERHRCLDQRLEALFVDAIHGEAVQTSIVLLLFYTTMEVWKMSRKTRSPEENARRAKIRELLGDINISSMEDIQDLFKETIAEFMENGLEAELDDELGYSKYDYKNKETENSRNGRSRKTLRTSFGYVELSIPRDRKGEYEPQLLKKNHTSISQDIEEKILSMYAKGMYSNSVYEQYVQNIMEIEKGIISLKLQAEDINSKERKELKTKIKNAEESVDAMKIARKSLHKFKSSFEIGLA